MSKARLDGLQLLLLGSVFFVLAGIAMGHFSPFGLGDLKQVYYGARSLMEHHDPYLPGELLALYRTEGGAIPSDPGTARSVGLIVSLCTNLPTTLLLAAPFALLPWKVAVALWLTLIASAFLLASFLMWDVAGNGAPRFSAGLLFLLIANSELLLSTGNAAGLVIGLTVITVWCFLRERYVLAGVVCLAVGLAIKPHDAGPVWLYFLLAGGVLRKRALQSLALAAVLSVPAILWVSSVAPHWPQELRANLSTSMSPGGRDAPGPSSAGGRGIGMVIALQAIAAQFRDDPRFYNPVVYVLLGALLLIWSVKTLRSTFSPRSAWFALAAISALAMLPVYHRVYDARLLLLTIPACTILWTEGGPLRWWAMLLNLAGILVTGDMTWAIVFHSVGYTPVSLAVGMIPAPLVLLVLGIFYLCVFVRCGAPSGRCAGERRQEIERPVDPGPLVFSVLRIWRAA